MKKTFLLRRNALLSARSISWGALALAGALLMLGVRISAPDFFGQLFAPVFRMSGAVAAESHILFSSFNNAAACAVQNEKLIDENAALASENQTLLKKVSNLSALLGTSPKNVSGIFGGVVARPPESPYDTLLVAVGEEDGVVLGMEAFGAGGVPIGVVSSVLTNFSRVTLFSAPNMVTSGWVGHDNLPLTILGAGGGAMRSAVARSAGVSVGDTVFVPGPGQLSLGSVTQVDSNPSSPGVVVHITSALNLFSITWVELRMTGVASSVVATSTVP